ncbi:conserved membrane hypothetical protein [Azospirillaceae bacterium]
MDGLWLASCLLALPVAQRIRLPAAALLGPMTMSAGLHLAGVTAVQPPALALVVAQLVIGASIGCRFSGVGLDAIRRCALTAILLTVLMVSAGVSAAFLLAPISGVEVALLILAFAPGGIAEMSMIALGLGLDIAFVSTHHISRVLMIVILAPVVFKLWNRQHSK